MTVFKLRFTLRICFGNLQKLIPPHPP